jgi:hypothetical protein
MKPSVTIIRGQNSSAISQKTWEIWDWDWDWDCECESGFVMKMENVNGQQPFQKVFKKLSPYLTIESNSDSLV